MSRQPTLIVVHKKGLKNYHKLVQDAINKFSRSFLANYDHWESSDVWFGQSLRKNWLLDADSGEWIVEAEKQLFRFSLHAHNSVPLCLLFCFYKTHTYTHTIDSSFLPLCSLTLLTFFVCFGITLWFFTWEGHNFPSRRRRCCFRGWTKLQNYAAIYFQFIKISSLGESFSSLEK